MGGGQKQIKVGVNKSSVTQIVLKKYIYITKERLGGHVRGVALLLWQALQSSWWYKQNECVGMWP